MVIGEPIPTPELVRGWAKIADERGAILEAIRYRDTADEMDRLRKFIESLDGKHVCRRDGDVFIDEAVIIAADILEV